MEWLNVYNYLAVQIYAPTPLSYAGMTQFRFKGTKEHSLSQPNGAPSGFYIIPIVPLINHDLVYLSNICCSTLLSLF